MEMVSNNVFVALHEMIHGDGQQQCLCSSVKYSQIQPVVPGVQGSSILGPYLFRIYVHDLFNATFYRCCIKL